MDFNTISGIFLSRKDATFVLRYFYTILHKLNHALDVASQQNLASQSHTVWDVLSFKRRDPQAFSTASAKQVIAGNIVSMIEEFKKITWEYSLTWPGARFKESAWETLGQSLKTGTINELSNWTSHEFGTRTITVEEENANFGRLVQYYQMLQPLVEELVDKLEAALADEDSWTSVEALNSRILVPGAVSSWYSKDCEAVQARLVREEEKLRVMFQRMEREEEARQNRLAGVKEVWVQEEVPGGEKWGS